MTKIFSEQRTLTIEHEQNSSHQQTLSLPPNNMLVLSARTGPPALARKLTLAGTTVSSLLYKKRKKHQTQRLGGPRTED